MPKLEIHYRVLAGLSLLLFAACQSAEEARRKEVEEIAAQHAAYVQEFQFAQAKFEAENPAPHRIDFGRDGSVLVREAGLQGRPGSESLRIKFTYVNSSGRTLDSAAVYLTLRDPKSGVEWSEVIDVRVPFGLQFAPNSTHTSYFEIPLRGIYRRTGWEWELAVETTEESFESDG